MYTTEEKLAEIKIEEELWEFEDIPLTPSVILVEELYSNKRIGRLIRKYRKVVKQNI